MAQGSLQLLTNLDEIRDAFSVWRNAMEQHGHRLGGVWWLAAGRIYFRRKGNDFKLGLDPTGDNWTVELNEPEQGTENPLSGVGRNSAGQRYLLRQGTLHKNAQSARIESHHFEERTGLKPAVVTIDSKPAKRVWFIVTALDCPAEEICLNTASFVDQCGLARNPDSAVIAKHDEKRLTELFGKPEQGGKVLGHPTINLNQRRRIQGEVWQKLNALLVAQGRSLDKPKHARGYEVDGEIQTSTERLLIEIKTDNSAESVYGGIGQLIVYPKLLPRLSGHRRVLLLPRSPSGALMEAIRQCDVDLHYYDLKVEGEEVIVCFSAPFLQLCDLESQQGWHGTAAP
ncbi:hypothetical protein ACVIW2_002118 [Bradyrhizobium huanghuaihaiense]|uniref:hypothetical protein n=1 Tax=Bradyrhizobium sp. B024 TaxID=3140247 RepID=UPI003183E95C